MRCDALALELIGDCRVVLVILLALSVSLHAGLELTRPRQTLWSLNAKQMEATRRGSLVKGSNSHQHYNFIPVVFELILSLPFFHPKRGTTT